MTTPKKPLVDEAEWQAQERGMRAALGEASAGLDSTAASYFTVASAVLSAPVSEPPTDFAASVAAHVAKREPVVERVMSRMLAAAFVVAATATVIIYGDAWWAALEPWRGSDALGWIVAGAGCVLMSWIPRQILDLLGEESSTTASRG